jgi:hypothetical protein
VEGDIAVEGIHAAFCRTVGQTYWRLELSVRTRCIVGGQSPPALGRHQTSLPNIPPCLVEWPCATVFAPPALEAATLRGLHIACTMAAAIVWALLLITLTPLPRRVAHTALGHCVALRVLGALSCTWHDLGGTVWTFPPFATQADRGERVTLAAGLHALLRALALGAVWPHDSDVALAHPVDTLPRTSAAVRAWLSRAIISPIATEAGTFFLEGIARAMTTAFVDALELATVLSSVPS